MYNEKSYYQKKETKMKLLRKLFINDKEFYKAACSVGIPIALQQLITVGVNMMDTIMVGKGLGETELSAVSLANSFISIFSIFCMGIGMGASVMVSRYFGMKRNDDMKISVAIMVKLTLIISSLFFVVTLLFPNEIMTMYSDKQSIIELGATYLIWSLASYFLSGIVVTCSIVLRCVGRGQLPLYASIGAFFINIGANYVFIFGKFGAPEMGVAGAALGTLIARVFEFAMVFGYLCLKDKIIGFKFKDIFRSTKVLNKEYIRICIPVLISDGILAFGNSAVAMVIGHLGESFTAANAVTAVTQQLSSVLTSGFSQAGAIVTGQSLGEGDVEKTQSRGYAFLGLGLSLGLVAAVIILAIKDLVIHSYGLSEGTAEIANMLMYSISIIVVFQATNGIMTKGVLRGGGDTKILMIMDNVFLWGFSIPLGLLAGFVLELSPFWIYFMLKIDQVIKLFWAIYRLNSKKWIKKIKTSEEIISGKTGPEPEN